MYSAYSRGFIRLLGEPLSTFQHASPLLFCCTCTTDDDCCYPTTTSDHIPALSSNIPLLPPTLSSSTLPLPVPLHTTFHATVLSTTQHTTIVNDGLFQCISCCRTPARHPLALFFSTLSSSSWPPQVGARERRSTRTATGCCGGDACCYSRAVVSAHLDSPISVFVAPSHT